MACAENVVPRSLFEACRSLRTSGVFPPSGGHRPETAQDHHPAQSGRQPFPMLGFNVERYATDGQGLPIRVRDWND
jgi:hypothetical protein